MPNPLFQQLQANSQPNNIIVAARQLQQTFRGNPQQEVDNLLRTGKVSQEQYNSAVQKAKQIMQFFK